MLYLAAAARTLLRRPKSILWEDKFFACKGNVHLRCRVTAQRKEDPLQKPLSLSLPQGPVVFWSAGSTVLDSPCSREDVYLQGRHCHVMSIIYSMWGVFIALGSARPASSPCSSQSWSNEVRELHCLNTRGRENESTLLLLSTRYSTQKLPARMKCRKKLVV